MAHRGFTQRASAILELVAK